MRAWGTEEQRGPTVPSLFLLGVIVGATVLLGPVADARPLATDRIAPRRADVVATFSSGTAFIEVAGQTASTRVRTGWMSLAMDDSRCVPSADDPCIYHLNELSFSVEDFSIGRRRRRINLKDVMVRNAISAGRNRDHGEGIRVRPPIPFVAQGLWNGDPFSIELEPDQEGVLEITDLVVTPEESRAAVFGRLTGEVDGREVRATFTTAADVPFINRPPIASAGPPVQATTDCIARVDMDSSGTVDPDGNLRGASYTIGGKGIGRAADTLHLPSGQHRLTLVATDAFGGQGFDTTTVTIEDDGTSKQVEGAAVVELSVPSGTEPEDFGLSARGDIELGPQASVLSQEGNGAPIASLANVSLGVASHVGDTYAPSGATVRNRGWVEGALHTEAFADLGRDTRIDGGIRRDEPSLPADSLSFHVPLPTEAAPAVHVSPGEDRVIDPGSYGRIVVQPRGQLEMRPGVYSTRSLRVAPDATLVSAPYAGGAPTILSVLDEVSYSGRVESSSDDPSLLVAYLGSQRWILHEAWHGWIVAPNAELVLGRGEHRGAFAGRDIRMRPFATLRHEPLSWDFVRTARHACAVEPRLTCVRRNPEGHYTAVFGYLNRLPNFGVTIPSGPFNRIDPGGPWQGQSLGFFPRLRARAFEVDFDTRAVWTLGGRQAIATPDGPPCP